MATTNSKMVLVEVITLSEAKVLWEKTFPQLKEMLEKKNDVSAALRGDFSILDDRREARNHCLGFVAALQTIGAIKKQGAE